MSTKVRVRFAPSPTGFMHLGNIRTALINYLFARQKNGDFVLRIEDTDVARNVNEASLKILEDLRWLGLSYDEGPSLGGECGPYLQSERTKLYQEKLDELIEQKKVYRCFCTTEELAQKRKEQMAAGKPPRYDRTCLHLSDDMVKQNLAGGTTSSEGKPFIWRFQLNPDQVFKVKSLARGEVVFEMKHFSDFALTRADGSFTFMFTNFVDDWLMKISHVIRGEDHLSNTAMQAALYDACGVELPTCWHLPMICNQKGEKLSKRDFGFALDDLKKEGFLPQAICNYLAIIGGSFKDEIQSLDELIHNFDFDNLKATGAIKYDLEKLKWINHKWIERLDSKELLPFIVPFLQEKLTVSQEVSAEKLSFFVDKVKGEANVLGDFPELLRFCFEDPKVDVAAIDEQVGKDKTTLVTTLLDEVMPHAGQPELFLETLKREGKEKGLKPREFLSVTRYLLTGVFRGMGIHDILEMLDEETIRRRLSVF